MQGMQEPIDIGPILREHVQVKPAGTGDLLTGVFAIERAARAGARHARRRLQHRGDLHKRLPDAADRLDAGGDLGRHALCIDVDQHPCRLARLVVD